MMGKILALSAGTVAGAAALLIVVGVLTDQRVCSLRSVRSIVDESVNRRLLNEAKIANLGSAMISGLGRVIGKDFGRHDLAYSYNISSITTVINDMGAASCTALIDVTLKMNQQVVSAQAHQISYTMRKDDGGTWIVSVDTSGLDN